MYGIEIFLLNEEEKTLRQKGQIYRLVQKSRHGRYLTTERPIQVTHQQMHTHMIFNYLKFTLKPLKRSYMFRSHDHPQGAYFVSC